jgi:uncharacterized protein
MKKMNPVVHFEMPAEDRQRMADFYTNVFGWEAQMFGEEMGNYVTVSTCELDENRMPKGVGMINGGFYQKTEGAVPSVVIAVDDIYASIKDVANGGGTVLGEPVEIPSIGWYVSFLDTEGNKVSLMQSFMK